MRGRFYTTDNRLLDSDLTELVEELAIDMTVRLGDKLFVRDYSRKDLAELIAPLISDLHTDDQSAVAWLLWDLIQDAKLIWFA